jgi:hypothetical protein
MMLLKKGQTTGQNRLHGGPSLKDKDGERAEPEEVSSVDKQLGRGLTDDHVGSALGS